MVWHMRHQVYDMRCFALNNIRLGDDLLDADVSLVEHFADALVLLCKFFTELGIFSAFLSSPYGISADVGKGVLYDAGWR